VTISKTIVYVNPKDVITKSQNGFKKTSLDRRQKDGFVPMIAPAAQPKPAAKARDKPKPRTKTKKKTVKKIGKPRLIARKKRGG